MLFFYLLYEVFGDRAMCVMTRGRSYEAALLCCALGALAPLADSGYVDLTKGWWGFWFVMSCVLV